MNKINAAKEIKEMRQKNVIRDIGILIISIAIAAILSQSGYLEKFLTGAHEWKFFGSFFSGIFFVSVFTVAPAGVILFKIAAAGSIWETAFLGALGALLGDYLIFKFIKDSIAEDISWLLQKTKKERLFSVFKLKIFRRLLPFLGAIIIASPLPDEIGLAMLGLSKLKTSLFIPLSFALNFFGILILSLFAK